MLGKERRQELAIELMELVGSVDHRETRLQLKHQTHVAELEIGVDQTDLSVRNPVQEQGQIGSKNCLATTTLS